MFCSLCTAPLKSLFPAPSHPVPTQVYWNLFNPASAEALGNVSGSDGTPMQGNDPLLPLICKGRGHPIRGSIAGTSRKSQALWRGYCLSVCNYGDYSPTTPSRTPAPEGPCCALNRLHFANGKLSSQTWQCGL